MLVPSREWAEDDQDPNSEDVSAHNGEEVIYSDLYQMEFQPEVAGICSIFYYFFYHNIQSEIVQRLKIAESKESLFFCFCLF